VRDRFFFSTNIATGKLLPEVVARSSRGRQWLSRKRCVLLGGETAEMPDFLCDGEYDIGGVSSWHRDREKIIDGKELNPAMCCSPLPSVGLHTKGLLAGAQVVS